MVVLNQIRMYKITKQLIKQRSTRPDRGSGYFSIKWHKKLNKNRRLHIKILTNLVNWKPWEKKGCRNKRLIYIPETVECQISMLPGNTGYNNAECTSFSFPWILCQLLRHNARITRTKSVSDFLIPTGVTDHPLNVNC